MFASATYATASHTVIVKVVNVSENSVDMTINLQGVGHVDPTGTAFVLTGDPKAVNTLDRAHEHCTQARDSDGRVGVVPPHVPALLFHRPAADGDTQIVNRRASPANWIVARTPAPESIGLPPWCPPAAQATA